MSKTTLITVFLFTLLIALATSCNKNKSCYDKALYKKHKNDGCQMDCPGVVGCDGKTYCNACIARTKGIRVE